MKLLSIRLARTLGFVDIQDLIPRGHIFYPEIVAAIIGRYSFQSFPKTPQDFDQEKGITFLDGKAGSIVIDKFTIWPRLLVAETRSNTNDSKQFIEDLLQWGKENFGLAYEPGIIRWAYVSGLAIHSELDLIEACSPLFGRIAKKAGTAVSEIWGDEVVYKPTNITAGHDPLTRKLQIATFYIQYLTDTHFSERKYLSESPLPTDMHIQFLEELEIELKKPSN